MELFLVGLVAISVGFILGMKLTAKAALPGLKEIEKTQAIDRANYLFTLRRELANLLIWRNPRRYVKLHEALSSELSSVSAWRVEEINKRLGELCVKYPSYNDFDIISSRDYVLYVDSASLFTYEELEARYRDIVTFWELSLVGTAGWKEGSLRGFISTDFSHKFNSAVLEHLSGYVERIEDTKLIAKIDQAIDTFYSHFDRNGFENENFAVRRFSGFSPDNRYVVHIKKTDEFAIYSSFIFDDGRESKSYYRSDSNYQNEKLLFANEALLNELKLPLQ
jgi:hypothetical protein